MQEFLPGTYSPYSGTPQNAPTPYDQSAASQGQSPGAGWVAGPSAGTWVNPQAIQNVNAGLTSGGYQKMGEGAPLPPAKPTATSAVTGQQVPADAMGQPLGFLTPQNLKPAAAAKPVKYLGK